MKQNKFLDEVAWLAQKQGYTSSLGNDDESLVILHEDSRVCRVSHDGEFFVPQDNRERGLAFRDQVDAAWEYVNAVENGPLLQADELPDGYALITEYNGIVLAGKDMGIHGYEFVSWQRDRDGNGFSLGHYHSNYTDAKEDFAQRAGLIPEYKQFHPDQAKALYWAAGAALKQGTLTGQEETLLHQCQHKLEKGYPEVGQMVSVLVAERGNPAELRSIRNSHHAIEEIVCGPLDTTDTPGNLRYYFNSDMDPAGYKDEQISRILPDGAVVGPLVVAAWNNVTESYRSLTQQEIASIRQEIDAPQYQPNQTQELRGPMMEMGWGEHN